MAKKNILIKSKERRKTQDIAAFLRQLADRLEENEITLQRGAEEISIEVPNRVTFKLNVKEKTKKRRTKHRLKMTLNWQDDDKTGDFVEVV
ncbi:MAG: amphi-Trp domain-containing protein [Anaerolineae bacterium]|jgi:amphi-Trp domain-containing protein